MEGFPNSPISSSHIYLLRACPLEVMTSQRLEHWNVVELTYATLQVELLQGDPWKRGQMPSRSHASVAYNKSHDLVWMLHETTGASPSGIACKFVWGRLLRERGWLDTLCSLLVGAGWVPPTS